jgi:hypothetical protein
MSARANPCPFAAKKRKEHRAERVSSWELRERTHAVNLSREVRGQYNNPQETPLGARKCISDAELFSHSRDYEC